ncbi:sulfite exporter TauE/SafE family protein [Noviherbaspirillum humi]|uniref:sulfite exporter TauE/SafE family protein n=1 Tax=Noviherbaspirillum humi TaxID=1688639 RepID=UPI001595F225|nr:TSUP family transporter [Noviherbaspirillum humi]
MSEYVVLCLAGFLAGLIDAVVGGGGLIQTPALFAVFPNITPATLLGTNKLASIWGTAAAAFSYAKKVKISWSTAAPAAAAAFVFSFLGAYLVTRIPPDFLRRLLPFILIAVAVYTLKKKDLGTVHQPAFTGNKEKALAGITGGSIGFYDGFFGPGTGSFLVFFFVRLFGFDFLHASAAAKVVNVSCNLAALLWFWHSGHMIWQLGAAMAVCNIGGSLIGSRLAIRYGSGFVRKLFLLVVSALIFKTGFDAFFR